MKVLIIGPVPWAGGGVERRAREISLRLCQSGHADVTIFGVSTDTKEIGHHQWKGISVEVFQRQQHFPYWPKGLYTKAKQSTKGLHLVDIQGTKSLEGILATLAARDILLVVTPHYHSGASSTFLSVLKKIYDPLVVKYLLAKARKIICVSQAERQLILDRFGSALGSKIVLIPNGVDVAKIQAQESQQFSGKLLLYVGRLEKYKNIHLILSAMVYLSAEYKLIIIGDGAYESELSHLVWELNLTDRVQILSGLSDEDVYKWYNTCNLVLNLSREEAFGITVLEALAAGKPVLVNNQIALAEFAAKFDQVYPIDAERLSSEQLAEEISKACSKEVKAADLSQYSWQSIADRVLGVYQEVLS